MRWPWQGFSDGPVARGRRLRAQRDWALCGVAISLALSRIETIRTARECGASVITGSDSPITRYVNVSIMTQTEKTTAQLPGSRPKGTGDCRMSISATQAIGAQLI